MTERCHRTKLSKYSYRSRAAANKARIHQSSNEHTPKLYVYGPCVECGGWHLTKSPPRPTWMEEE